MTQTILAVPPSCALHARHRPSFIRSPQALYLLGAADAAERDAAAFDPADAADGGADASAAVMAAALATAHPSGERGGSGAKLDKQVEQALLGEVRERADYAMRAVVCGRGRRIARLNHWT